MLKCVGFDIVFQEFPDEVSLALNLSCCPHRCPGCHSSYLQQDVGKELNEEELKKMLSDYVGEITCVGFMGGDNDPDRVNELAMFVKKEYHNTLKVGWYSGNTQIPSSFNTTSFDYIKIGPYIASKGPLDQPTTNQRLYRLNSEHIEEDITNRFWKK